MSPFSLPKLSTLSSSLVLGATLLATPASFAVSDDEGDTPGKAPAAAAAAPATTSDKEEQKKLGKELAEYLSKTIEGLPLPDWVKKLPAPKPRRVNYTVYDVRPGGYSEEHIRKAFGPAEYTMDGYTHPHNLEELKYDVERMRGHLESRLEEFPLEKLKDPAFKAALGALLEPNENLVGLDYYCRFLSSLQTPSSLYRSRCSSLLDKEYNPEAPCRIQPIEEILLVEATAKKIVDLILSRFPPEEGVSFPLVHKKALKDDLNSVPNSLLQQPWFFEAIDRVLDEREPTGIFPPRVSDYAQGIGALTEVVVFLHALDRPFSEQQLESILGVPYLLRKQDDLIQIDERKAHKFALLLNSLDASIPLETDKLGAVYDGEGILWPIPFRYETTEEKQHLANCTFLLLQATPEQIWAIRKADWLRNPVCSRHYSAAQIPRNQETELQVIRELIRLPAPLISALEERGAPSYEGLFHGLNQEQHIALLGKFTPETSVENVHLIAHNQRKLLKGLDAAERVVVLGALVTLGSDHLNAIIRESDALFQTGSLREMDASCRHAFIQALSTCDPNRIPEIAKILDKTTGQGLKKFHAGGRYELLAPFQLPQAPSAPTSESPT